MSDWIGNLRTERGARSAAQLGGLASLMAAFVLVLALIGVASVGFAGIPMIVLLIVGLEIAILAIAAVRMRGGKGLIWGGLAALVLLFLICNEIVAALDSLSADGTISAFIAITFCAHVVLLPGLLYGLRAVFALRSSKFDAPDPAPVFS